MQAKGRVETEKLIRNVPEILKQQKAWVGYILKKCEGRTDKVPMDVLKARPAKSNDPTTWTDFDSVLDLADQQGYNGVGFMFQPPFVGIDLDYCVDENGNISAFALDVINQMNCYCEYSPSGRGIHLICQGKISRARKISQLGLEVYTKGRFFTVTGNRLESYSQQVDERSKELTALLKKYASSKSADKGIERVWAAINASNDAKFKKLFNGQWRDDYSTQSEADLALCNKLAFWTARDTVLMDTIFRQSKLYRAKWDEQHYGDGRTYGQGVIDKAVASCDEVYQTNGNGSRADISNNNLIADQIIKDHVLIYYADKYYEYRDGCYRPRYIEEVHKWIKRITRQKFSVSKVNNILLALRTETFKKPDDIKGVQCLNLKNGLFDIDTYELKPHSPSVFSINQLNVNYDNNARCALWLKSLSEIFEGDAERIGLLQEYFGYCLTRETDYEKALFLNGEGANGKTVILYVLEQLLGKDNISSVPLEKFNDFHYLARLSGSLANISIETNAKSEVYDNTFKAVVTGDTISADAKYGQPFEFKPFCKLVFSTNNLPRVDDKTEGFYRRLLIIRFNRQFSKEERDPKLKYKIVKDELDGVFIWALEGLQRLRKRGYFDDSRVMDEEIINYRMENNNVMNFVEDSCQMEELSTIANTELYKRYAQWCKDNGYRGFSKIKFGKELVRLFPDLKKDRACDHRYWQGINVVGEEDDPRPY